VHYIHVEMTARDEDEDEDERGDEGGKIEGVKIDEDEDVDSMPQSDGESGEEDGVAASSVPIPRHGKRQLHAMHLLSGTLERGLTTQ